MANEAEDDWTQVGKKRENKSGGQNKPKKNHESQGPKNGGSNHNNHNSRHQKGKSGKGNKHSNTPPTKSKPQPQIVKMPSADSSMILASKSDETIEKAEPAVVLPNPWNNTPKFSETMSVSQGIKDLQISDINANSIKPEEFARICRSFDVKSTSLAKFHTRGMMNTGYACFRNCILQALLSLTPFMSLITTIIQEIDLRTVPSPPFTVWREVVAVYREFTQSTNSNRQASGNGKNKHGGNSISANLFMTSLFTSFNESVASRQPNRRTDTSKPFFSQEDAMEFLTYLLDALHEEIFQFEAANSIDGAASETVTAVVAGEPESGNSTATSSDEADDEAESHSNTSNSGWNTVTTKKPVKSVVDDKSKDIVTKASEASVISKLFHCTLRSKVHYKQKKLDSITFQRLFCVTLDVRSTAFANKLAAAASETKEVSKSVSVEQCLDLYFEEESIDEGEIKKQLKFDTLPEILVLQLSRFFFDYYKNLSVKVMQEVTYPLELQLTENHMSEELVSRLTKTSNNSSNGLEAATYSLSSVVLHHGENATKGHYSTLARDPNEPTMWRALNDTKVSSLKEEQVTSAKSLAYLLFYQRKNSREEVN